MWASGLRSPHHSVLVRGAQGGVDIGTKFSFTIYIADISGAPRPKVEWFFLVLRVHLQSADKTGYLLALTWDFRSLQNS